MSECLNKYCQCGLSAERLTLTEAARWSTVENCSYSGLYEGEAAYKCDRMSGLRSRLLWRGSFDKFPSVPLISLRALGRGQKLSRRALLEVSFCFVLPNEILSKWKPSRRSNSCELHCNCMENMYQPFRSHSGLWKVVKHHHNKWELCHFFSASSRIGLGNAIIIGNL